MKLIINKENPEGIEVELTAEEQATRDAEVAQSIADNEARETAKTQKEADALSGNQKLLDLGLTQAEATALTGYTPPVEE
jgi:hypothetical protein